MDEYIIISKFICHGKEMVIVKAAHGTHVMTSEEMNSLRGNQSTFCFANQRTVA